MKTEQMLDEMREANLTDLILAQRPLQKDRAEAIFRLGVSEDVAEIVSNLSTALLVKIAGRPTPFTLDDDAVALLTGVAVDAVHA